MAGSSPNIGSISVRLAQDAAEIEAAQHLRYRVFYEEYAATPSPEMARSRKDFDGYDEVADHLVVVDELIKDPRQRIVGTYRLLRQEAADKFGQFYTCSEYDITPLMNSGTTLLELGRSCVLADYRTRPVLQLLWQGITDYMLDHGIGLMFGCASLPGTDAAALAAPLSYLYHFHLAPPELRPRALQGRYVDMDMLSRDNLNPRALFSALPPLVKGYLRLGAYVGDGAVIDHQFNTTDVCIVLPMQQVAARYRKFYGRKVNRVIPGADDEAEIPALAQGAE